MAKSLTQEEEEREYRKYRSYARSTGCMPLNDVFKIKAPKKTTNNRFVNINIKASEALWGLGFAIIVITFQLIMRSIITPNNVFLKMMWGWEGMLFWVLLFFALGVFLSRRSPYRKHSGEDATAYFKVNAIMLFNKIFVKFGMIPAVYKPIISTMVDRTTNMEQVTYGKVYIGICPTDYVAKVGNPYDLEESHRIRAVSEKALKKRIQKEKALKV